MLIDRKKFLKAAGGIGLGLLAGPLVAGSNTPTADTLTLRGCEEKHLARFYTQLRESAFPPSENAIRGFQPVRLLKRKVKLRGYHTEFITESGTKIVLKSKNGKSFTQVFP